MSEASGVARVVLIVDPDGVASGALGRSLKRLGCEPQSCWDMHAALIAARAERPALVIASAELLDGDGFMLCDHLRAEASLVGLPVVLLCDESATTAVQAHEASPNKADAYLFRPLSVTAILQRVGRFLTGAEGPAAVDDDELSLDSAVEVIEQEAPKKPPPPPKRPAQRPASVVPEARESALPSAPRLPQIELENEPPPRTSKSVFPSLAPLASTGAGRPSGVSTRDFLDLREQLNTREREIHRLREELQAADARQREALERTEGLRAANLELLDKIRERDEALSGTAALMQQLEAARADKDLANKRAETYVAKAERAKQAAEREHEELAAEKERSRALVAAHGEEIEKLEARHRDELAAALENAERTSFDAVHRARTELEEAHDRAIEALRERVARADEDRERALAEQRAAHEVALGEERERAERELDVARARNERDVANAREEAAARAAEERARALEALRVELAGAFEKQAAGLRNAIESDLRRAHEKALLTERSRAESDSMQAIAEHESQLRAQFDRKYAELRASLESEAAVALTAAEDRHRRVLAEAETKHEAALKKQRDELESALRAERDALLEEARLGADAEVRAVERMTDLQLADMIRQRDKAREEAERHVAEVAAAGQKLREIERQLAEENKRRVAAEERLEQDRELLSRARDSLAEAMASVDLARGQNR